MARNCLSKSSWSCLFIFSRPATRNIPWKNSQPRQVFRVPVRSRLGENPSAVRNLTRCRCLNMDAGGLDEGNAMPPAQYYSPYSESNGSGRLARAVRRVLLAAVAALCGAGLGAFGVFALVSALMAPPPQQNARVVPSPEASAPVGHTDSAAQQEPQAAQGPQAQQEAPASADAESSSAAVTVQPIDSPASPAAAVAPASQQPPAPKLVTPQAPPQESNVVQTKPEQPLTARQAAIGRTRTGRSGDGRDDANRRLRLNTRIPPLLRRLIPARMQRGRRVTTKTAAKRRVRQDLRHPTTRTRRGAATVGDVG
jgi:hypothetical protein